MEYEGYPFRTDELRANKDGWVNSLGVAHKSRVEKVVAVEDGKITENIDANGAEVWWWMDCMARSGSSFQVLYDGEKWLPMRRGELSVDLRPQPTVNLEEMCVRDQILFDAAIQEFKSK